MSFLKWEAGRQGSGYQKLLLARSKRLRFDCYLLRYPKGAYIPSHIDRGTDGFRHYRLNVVLKKAKEGGCFRHRGTLMSAGWVSLFRPDLSQHSVSRIAQGTRWVFSIGWLTREKSRERR